MKSVMRVLIFLIIYLLLFMTPSEVIAKIYDRCELARELRYTRHIPVDHVAVWVCIAQYQSGFNTAALAQHSDGGYHGMYQISDAFWCSPWGAGKECNLDCARLRDENLSDDFLCMSQIYNEHQKISGDGYNAWTVYKQYCNYGKSDQYVSDCFGANDVLLQTNSVSGYQAYQSVNYIARTDSYVNAFVQQSPNEYKTKTGKVYERCELARELLYQHQMPMEQIANWVCIAYHESNFNTSAIGRLNADGSGDHGLFQISDIYWCSPPGKGWVCGLSCAQLENDDISDDVECMKKMYDEHTRISEDGFNAWSVYQPYCLGRSSQFTDGCFTDNDQNEIYKNYVATSAVTQIYYTQTKTNKKLKPTGKVYDRCELARELKYVHNFPDDQIATWVCIVQHESSYNVSAVGRLNTDGSGDHGLFQISDIYWCSPPGKGGACGLTCLELEDNDITDDVECVKKIYEEHTRISGDGFNAWTMYSRYCKDKAFKYTDGCFDDGVLKTYKTSTLKLHTPVTEPGTKPAKPGKVYDRCELARELKFVYNFPDDQIATWVCIAQHESSYNTSAVSRLNIDGSGDHGLFQISDIYWCSPPGKGYACGLKCSELEDGDISNDVECVRKIYEEHTRISGDGFNAWTVYPRYCKDRAHKYVDECFDDGVLKTYKPSIFTSMTKPFIQKSKPGKIYNRCELARELKYVHNFPDDELATWVCIAQHESSFNTSAIGRLNLDGSGDHGLFQISDIYWCSPPGKGYACGLTCSELEDGDITNDVECIRRIHEEHTRISGDGFNAWTVYSRYCKDRAHKYLDGCFDEGVIKTYKPTVYLSATKPTAKKAEPGKVYDRCELARELKYVYNFPDEQISTWVCIVQHESNYNTSAVGRLTLDGSGDHGLFQISDIYWCSPPGKGYACGLTCAALEDGDITDDIECVRRIHEEHTRLSGDGFNAWTVYSRYCQNKAHKYTDGCFADGELQIYKSTAVTNKIEKIKKHGKIYDRCELARELKYTHNFPDDQIATWVCIVQHESNFNTSVVGQLNGDGSGDHGLFQISDIYWCSPPNKGWACSLTCSELEDGDITDDVECVRKIYEEHTRISGDGFDAWTVYPRYCKGRANSYIEGCFETNSFNTFTPSVYTPSSYTTYAATTAFKPPKIYERCELAKELKYIHNFPDDELATWVCIAQHESNLNTSAVGQLNRDGSGDHGLFQISDIFWCSPPGKGYACGLTCSQLEDNDIQDDVVCARRIYEEHKRISGDGFNAWTVYARYCKGRADTYIVDCFTETTSQSNQQQSYYSSSYQNQRTTSMSMAQHYPKNPFFINTQSSVIPTTPSTYTDVKYSSSVSGYSNFNQQNTQTMSSLLNTPQTSTVSKTTLENNVFVNGFFESVTQKPITKPPVTTNQIQFFTPPQTYSTYQTSYQPTKYYQSFNPASTQTSSSYTTTNSGFYNQYTQQASTKNIVNTKPDTLSPTTTKPTTIKQKITTKEPFKWTTNAPITKWTTKAPTTRWTTTKSSFKPYTFKPFVFSSTTVIPTIQTTRSSSTTKSIFQFPTITIKPTTRSSFLSNSFFTQTTKVPQFTTTTTRPTTTTLRTTSRTKSTTIKPVLELTTRSSVFDRFATTILKPTTKPFKFAPYFTSTSTPRSTTKSTIAPFRFTFPASTYKFTTKSIFDLSTTKLTTPRPTVSILTKTTTKTTTPRATTTTQPTIKSKYTTRFDFDAFFSKKPTTTPSSRTIRATAPLTKITRITAQPTPQTNSRQTTTTHFTTRSTTRSTTPSTTPRSSTKSTTRSTIRTTTLQSGPKSTSRSTIRFTTRPTTRSTMKSTIRSTPRPITSTLRSPFEILTTKKSLTTTTSRPPPTTSKTTLSITLSRSIFNNNNNNLNIINKITKQPKIETTSTTPSTTTKASPFDLWFDKLTH